MRAYLHPLTSLYFLFVGVVLLIGCQPQSTPTLRLATTTSTYDSGLLDELIPQFEAQYDAQVDVVAVGTGQALALGEAGDADLLLVHSPDREAAFIASGHGTARFDVMYNDFVIVGPAADPARISGLVLAADAFLQIANSKATFASRGDDSGTHIKEGALWTSAEFDGYPTGDWYKSLGQGMGDTLRFANETAAYTLTDRGTFLATKDSLPNLTLLVGGESIAQNEDEMLFNPYGIILVNPNKGNINDSLGLQFVEWLTAVDTQYAISTYGLDIMGQPLFYPNSIPWHNQ